MAVHGVENKEVQTGPSQVAEVPSGITALVGIAPKGPINSMIKVSGLAQAAQFGSLVPGFDIPTALDSHFAEGGQPVLVVNAFDPTLHTAAVSAEAVTMVGGKGKTAFAPIANIIVTHTSGTPVYVPGTDYSIDDFGNIKSLKNTSIAQNASIKVSYKKLDASLTTASLIIGAVDGTTLARTGFKVLEKAYNIHLVEPKIIVSPGFSHLSAVQTEMVYWAERYGGVALIDAPAGTTVPVAIAGRIPGGTIPFDISNERAWLLFPRLKGYDPATDTYVARPYSQFMSGIIGATDNKYDIHWSVSNKPIKSAKGVDIEMTSSAIIRDTDAQSLNDAGIITVLQEGAGNMRVFGNYSSAWPASTKITSFHSVRRVQDIAIRSMMYALVQYMDMPMIPAVRDAILETANDYLRSLVGRGALLDGTAVFEPGKNTVDRIAQGWWTITTRSCPPPPAQRITIESYVDIQMVSVLNENLA